MFSLIPFNHGITFYDNGVVARYRGFAASILYHWVLTLFSEDFSEQHEFLNTKKQISFEHLPFVR